MKSDFIHAITVVFCACTTPHLTPAKFSHVYPGIAQDGLDLCLNDPDFNLTSDTIILRENVRKSFACITKNIPNDGQSILSSGPSIVGIIPTAVTLLGSRRVDIMGIHLKLAILAFLLTFAGLAVGGERRAASFHQDCLSYYANVKQEPKLTRGVLNCLWSVPSDIPRTIQRVLLAMHIFGCLLVSLLLWETYDLS